MPRRNRNAHATTVSRDMPADQAARLARDLAAPVACAGCQANPPPKATIAPCARA
jgi:hypothetical protein